MRRRKSLILTTSVNQALISTLPYIDDRSGFQAGRFAQRPNKIIFPLMKQWEKIDSIVASDNKNKFVYNISILTTYFNKFSDKI